MPFSDWYGIYLGLQPLGELTAGFLCESVKPKSGKKAKRDLQEAPTLVSIIEILFWKLPHSALREFGFCEFCSWTICSYHLPCRSVSGACCGKETKIFRFPDYCPCFCHLPPSCAQVQRKKIVGRYSLTRSSTIWFPWLSCSPYYSEGASAQRKEIL